MFGPIPPPSPVFGLDVEGYLPQVAVAPGETLEVMLSGTGSAQLSVVRLIHGDPNPAGPGYRDEEVAWHEPIRVAVPPQDTDFGSYIEIPHGDSLNPLGTFTLALWLRPTLLTQRWQALAAKWAPGELCFGLFCVGQRMLVAAVSHDGISAEWCTAGEFIECDNWQFIAFVYDAATGEACFHQSSLAGASSLTRTDATHGPPFTRSAKRLAPGALYRGSAPLLLGALPLSTGTGHWAHFNGKIAAPTLFGRALDESELSELRNGGARAAVDAVGAWDLSREVSGVRVVDVSGHGHHGSAVNAPARAVTGPRWNGMPASLYSDDAEAYDAIHLHEDDLADAGWRSVADLPVPADVRSAIYAVRVEGERGSLTLPFVVRAARPSARLLVLVPTLTWQAYASNRAPYSYTEDGIVDRGLCLYDVHTDGSIVLYTTRRKPTRAGDPSAGIRQWGAHTVPANLYLVDWLEHKGFAHDVAADEHLDSDGADLLRAYRCIVLGSHAEYWTSSMLDALETYLDEGGHVAYLGGNGLYWVTSLDPGRPHVMEVRKSGDGDYEDYFARPEPGQMQHSTTLEVGGLWARRGRAPHRLIGVEHSANVFHGGDGPWGFRRLPASRHPRYAFIFEGVGDDEVIGNFGLNLGSAAAYEMDAVQDWPWRADWRPVTLARATHPTFFSPMRMPVSAACDIALTTSPAGGAVFAAGSVTWTGSLSHASYDNNVSRITENVLRRFLDTPAGASILSP